MRTRTEKEIRQFCSALWAHASETPTITVEILADLTRVRIKSMYKSPDLNLEILMKLAEFMGTKNINDDDRFAYSGCETCDYGSSYGFTLTIRPEK